MKGAPFPRHARFCVWPLFQEGTGGRSVARKVDRTVQLRKIMDHKQHSKLALLLFIADIDPNQSK